MATEIQQSSGRQSFAVPLIEARADVVQIADATVEKWLEIATTLSPILGEQGVSALYRRSIQLSSATYPWLLSAIDGVATIHDHAALRTALLQQGSVDATRAGNCLFQTLYTVLTTLIGSALTEHLLHPVWTDSSSCTRQDGSACPPE